MKIKKKIKAKLVSTKRKIALYFTQTYYVSIGENCLTDNILSRHHIKSFTTIYAHSRSNIDYAIHLEKEKYHHLLDPQYLYHDNIEKTQVVRNNHYANSSNIYHSLHQNGFEFTHHNVLDNPKAKESAERKIERLNFWRGKKNFKFFYHYRINNQLNLELLIKKAKEFNSFYNIGNKKSEIIIFTQKLVSQASERKLEKYLIEQEVKVFILHTTDSWEGNNTEIFWAKNDEDLIKIMLENIA